MARARFGTACSPVPRHRAYQGSGTPAVYVDRSTPTPDGYGVDISFVGIFTLPSADSALTITAVNGSIVDLQTQTGHVYHFDLSVNQYR